MHITIVQGAFFPVPPVRGGAVEKAWDALGRQFARRGHVVTHVSRRCDGLPADEVRAGVRHVRVRGHDQPRAALRLKALDLLYTRRALRVLPPADLLVSHTFWLPLLAREVSRGRIYVQVGRFPKGQLRWYKHAARLQCVSGAVAAAAHRQAPALAARVNVIPYPLPDDAWQADAPPDAARDNLVLYAGRIHPEKGLDLLAEAWAHPETRARLAEWKLVLAGPWAVAQGGGGEAYRARLAARLRPAGASVEWTGPLFGADGGRLTALYRRARIFAYPSVADTGESFGLAPLEAMAAGAPALVSGLECFRDFLRDGGNGAVFDHRAPDAAARLRAALLALAADAPRRAALGVAAHAAAARFRVEEVAGRYLDDFESVRAAPDPRS